MKDETVKEHYVQTSMLKDIAEAKNLNTTKYTYKSHELIESSYELSITEQRIISLACKKLQPIYIENKIKPEDLENVLGIMKFSMIKISVNEYKREYNINSKNIYGILKETCQDFFKKQINYYEGNKLVTKRWISTAKYDDDNGAFYLTFNPDMITDLLVFKGKYVALFFDMSQNIKSKYAFRIYEILKSNSYLGNYEVPLSVFKFMLNIDEGSYSEFSNFNSRVIKPNLKVINEYSDIDVVCKPLRNGRAVTDLKFTITNKPKTLSQDSNFKNRIPKSYSEISKALEKHKITLSSGDAEVLFNNAIEATVKNNINIDVTSYILEKIRYMEEYSVNVKGIDNIMSFLIWAIKTNYIYESKIIEKGKKKLNFDNFTGRGVDYYSNPDLERKLLGWDDEEDE